MMENDNVCPYNCNKCYNMPMGNGWGMINYGMPMNMPQDVCTQGCPMCGYNMSRGMQNAQPLYSIYNDIHKMMLQCIKMVMSNMMNINMGQMPQTISKMDFDKCVNNVMAEMMKNEQTMKNELMRSVSEDSEDRGVMCPMCNSWMKTLVEFAVINQLYSNGVGYII